MVAVPAHSQLNGFASCLRLGSGIGMPKACPLKP
jgi:hypothetical protein